MNRHIFILLTQAVLVIRVSGKLCNHRNINIVGRIVFGEARRESMMGQLNVAYSIVNRLGHPSYPDTLDEVVDEKTNNGSYQYETLNNDIDTQAWNYAKQTGTDEYDNAHAVSYDALCSRKIDTISCATDYCAFDPCNATNSIMGGTATRKMKIGKRYFVCREPAY
ncbi:uncharacterized protein LOC130054433 [Ostrea edulis]|uniref:uncharacterized protein LOC130054433 n=1 Tax=Ostrea edulis TaxID=37623 RepID=UPI0024AFFF2A|nr:uncharacterized protein LOC130054433 [Ostrea edulis]